MIEASGRADAMSGGRFGGIASDLRAAYEGAAAGALGDSQMLDRFAARGDEIAFAAVVARHGPMVLAVCRGVLRSRDDAEDAFQATFLILARKAGTLRRGESLGGWLQRVARRVAIKANGDASRRLARERAAARASDEKNPPAGPWDDALPLLHEEIGRLPEKYRAPIVLCDLEELTRDEAAGQLGWPPGTVAGRLARARELLRARLARRGVAPSVATLALAASAREASAAPPQAWVEATIEAASNFSKAGAGMSSAVANLAKGTMTAMLISEIRRASTSTLTAGLALAAAATLLLARPEPQAEPRPTVPLSGLVLDSDGRPAADVAVFASTRGGTPRWGQVVAQARTDAEGRFRIDLPAAESNRSASYSHADTLWAYRPGRLLASLPISRDSISPDVTVKLVLGPPSITTFIVRDPDGKPVAGAMVEPRVLFRNFQSVPDGLAGRIAAATITDARGRATLSALLPEEISTVIVAAKGYGTQQFGVDSGGSKLGGRVLDLLPVGRLDGRIVGDPALIGRRSLTVAASNKSRPAAPAAGLYSITTDDEGRFVVPEIVAGVASVELGDRDAASPWYIKVGRGVAIEPGKTTEVALPLSRGVAVRGLVSERGTGRPVPGASIGFSTRGSGVVSDEQGRFRGFAPPGLARVALLGSPDGYASPMYALPDARIPEDATEHELPPIELSRARVVRGAVVDDQGRPAPGARVAAAWKVDEGARRQGTREVEIKADGKGEFRLDRVPIDAQVTLQASLLGLRTAGPVVAGETAAGPVRLRLESGRTAAMSGRVLARGGSPVAGARVHLRAQKRYPSGQVQGDDLVTFDGAMVLMTDPEGRFRTPVLLEADGEYAALAEADGFEARRTGWVPSKSAAFPDLILPPELGSATIRGRVLDRRGRVVAGASVRSPGQAAVRPDEAGRFRIEGLTPGPVLLFAEAPGFRFHGQVVSGPTEDFDATLTRLDEAPAARMTTLPLAPAREEQMALARRVLGPLVDRLLKEGGENELYRALRPLAACDPARVLAILAERKFQVDYRADFLKADAAKALNRTSPDEAAALVESIDEPSRRASAIIDACDALPASDRAGKLASLDRALVAARAIGGPADKVILVAKVAEHLLDLGETARAMALLREFEPVANGLARAALPGYARGAFAEELAQVDPDAGLALMEGVDGGPEPDRHLINLVQELASRDPARAEAALERLKKPESLRLYLSRIAHAMATKDPERARRLVDRAGTLGDLDGYTAYAQPHARGMIALAVAEADRPLALALIQQAFADLGRMHADGTTGRAGAQDAATVAAALLPVVERVDPALVPEYFWRAASLGDRRLASTKERAEHESALALFLARYDREAAAVVLAPVLALSPGEPGLDLGEVIRAEAAIDPARAVARLEALPDDPTPGFDRFRNPKNEARLALASFLAADPSRRWDAMTEKVLQLWTVGREDIF